MHRLLSIDEIYDRVKDFDLVVTNDVALATALNSRISFPMIGYFAMTPRQIASLLAPAEMASGIMRDIDIISMIKEETGFNLRYIYSEIKNFRDIRKHTHEVTNYLTSSRSRKVYDSYLALPTYEKVMGAFDTDVSEFFEGKRVAVVGCEFFDSLDKHFIPIEADFIDIFTDEPFSIPEMRVIGNDRQIAENAVDLIDSENPDDFAVVLNVSSPIADAVRSALYRRKLPFINRMDVRDMAPIRDYLSFLTLSFTYDTIRVSQIKELFAAYNGFFKPRNEKFMLSRLDPESMRDRAVDLRELMRAICEDGITFGEVRDRFCMRSTASHVTNILRDLGIEDEIVTPNCLSDLRYAVDNISDLTNNEQISDNEKSGVLIVDCTNSVYIDRPVVLFLGMEQDWNIPVIGKRYLDAEDESERNSFRLEALLQQGQRRVYMVNSTKRGESARPTNSFLLMMNRDLGSSDTRNPCNTFADVCDRLVEGRWVMQSEPKVVSRGEIRIDPDTEFERKFSKSTYNAYYKCPRNYMFKIALKTPDSKEAEFGNLIHAFAEFYACYPNVVKGKGIDHFVDLVSDHHAGLSSPMMASLDRDSIHRAMSNVVRFMDERGIKELSLESVSRENPNVFFEKEGLVKYSSICESDRVSSQHQIHGKFDLLWNSSVVDYKTGKAKGLNEITKALIPGNNENFPEFQPLIYLGLARDTTGMKEINFEQLYVQDGISKSPDEFKISDCIRRISYTDSTLIEASFGNPDFRDFVFNTVSEAVKKKFDGFYEVLKNNASGSPETWASDTDLVLKVTAGSGYSEAPTNTKNIRNGIEKVAGLLSDGIVRLGDEILIPRDTLDAFLGGVDEMYSEVRRYYHTDFPPKPRKDCSKCDYRSVCMEVIIDDMEEGDSDE